MSFGVCPVCDASFCEELEDGINECDACGARILFEPGDVHQQDRIAALDEETNALFDRITSEKSRKAADALFPENPKETLLSRD